MFRYGFIVIVVLYILSIPVAESLAVKTTSDALADVMRARIEAERYDNRFICRGELVCGISIIPKFYQDRGFKPAWCGNAGVSDMALNLLEVIRESTREGLRPNDYHLMRLESMVAEVKLKQSLKQPLDKELLIDLDLLMTDAFLLLASHLLAGRVNPETIHAEWVAANPEIDLGAVLQSALETHQVKAVLNRLRPPQSGYHALKDVLQRYRHIARQGGWPVLPAGVRWRKGDHGARYHLLRKLLELTGDLGPAKPTHAYIFDDAVETAIRQFQKRHGLKPDGIMGEATLAALNIPVEERIRQIELNLERWRWIPHELGRRYILVNIADFKLTVVESHKTVLDMRVVVGKDFWKTPVFSQNMTYLVLNPYWNIPRKIAIEEMLPKVKRNPRFLSRRKIKVFKSWNAGARELNPGTIDWSKVNEENFSFKFRKEPGPRNDLGRIKFMLPNKFAVYLHDTPHKRLFRRSNRDFSHGCIRVEKAIDLAAHLLNDNPRWTRRKILEGIKTSERQVIRLQNPIPVHVLYWTAWVDQDGLMNFRDDIYERDTSLDYALRERPPRA